MNYLRFDYIRNLQNLTSFYTKDIDATISVLNLENEWASIFVENRALTTNLTINLDSASVAQELFLYIMDSEAKYSITGNTVIRNKATGKTITINNPNSRPINIYFNETYVSVGSRDDVIMNKSDLLPGIYYYGYCVYRGGQGGSKTFQLPYVVTVLPGKETVVNLEY